MASSQLLEIRSFFKGAGKKVILAFLAQNLEFAEFAFMNYDLQLKNTRVLSQVSCVFIGVDVYKTGLCLGFFVWYGFLIKLWCN